MKRSYNILLFCFLTLLFACEKEKETDNTEETTTTPVNELENLKLVQSHTEDDFKLEFYTSTGKLEQGYNHITVAIKDLNDKLLENPQVAWKTEMTMMSKKHGSPFSSLTQKEGSSTLLEGFIVFQMASNDSEYWEIEWTVTQNQHEHVFKTKVDILSQISIRTQVFTGTDGTKYVLSLASSPFSNVGANSIKAYLHKMETMYSFPIVNNYTIEIDPRMPAMGNHSSPNNVALTQVNGSNEYTGTVNFTMTGYWKINLLLKNNNAETIKGETITETTESSSIYFDTEF